MTPVAARRAPVTVRTAGAAVVLELADLLDAQIGAALVAAAEAALVVEEVRAAVEVPKILMWANPVESVEPMQPELTSVMCMQKN